MTVRHRARAAGPARTATRPTKQQPKRKSRPTKRAQQTVKRHLTKIKAGANVHSYVDPAEPHTMHGQLSRCVLQLNNDAWCVEYRDGARFVDRTTYDTARQAVTKAKAGGRVSRTITGPGWSAFMADQLYNTPCGATDALQAYVDRCHRRGLRPDLHRFMHAHKTTGAND